MLPYGKWYRSARVTSCGPVSSLQHRPNPSGRVFERATHITSEVLLLSQDDLVRIEPLFKLSGELLHKLLVRGLLKARLENFLPDDDRRDRIKVRILDARRLLKLGVGLGVAGDQLCARPERRDVPPDGARLEQLKPIILLKIRQKE